MTMLFCHYGSSLAQFFFFFQAEDGIRDLTVTGVQTCALPILRMEPFAPGQLALLEDLTGRAALAYDNARLYAERAHVAHTLRHSLMPAALPKIPGLQLESFFRPMSAGSEVGGDFYDVFGDRGVCWLVVGD